MILKAKPGFSWVCVQLHDGWIGAAKRMAKRERKSLPNFLMWALIEYIGDAETLPEVRRRVAAFEAGRTKVYTAEEIGKRYGILLRGAKKRRADKRGKYTR